MTKFYNNIYKIFAVTLLVTVVNFFVAAEELSLGWRNGGSKGFFWGLGLALEIPLVLASLGFFIISIIRIFKFREFRYLVRLLILFFIAFLLLLFIDNMITTY